MPPLNSYRRDPEAEHPQYAGQYRLESVLGSGGMGVVYLSHSTSGKRLAVKVVHEELAADPEFRARFRQEVAAARRVSGAFTAPVVDADPEAERPWMATLFIPGPTLSEFVKRKGPLPAAELRHVMTGLTEALRDIHRAGVVHRDLKPSNVLLAADGPKVIDFGISRPSDSALRTETGKLIGTPPFMAPEQFSQPRSVGPAADVFAMASVLVHAATGRGPFDSDSPYVVAYQVVHDKPVLKGIPEDLLPLIERCLAKEPEERPTPDILMAELRAVSASYDTQSFAQFDTTSFVPAQRQPVHDEHVSQALKPESRPRVSRRTATAAVALGATLAVLGTAGVLAAQRFTGPERSDPAGTPNAGTSAFRSWDRVLGNGTATPVCSYAATAPALFCAGPGVKAARLDPATGRVLWSRSAGSASNRDTGRPAPVLRDGVLRVVTPDGSRLEGLAPATGKARWTVDISTYNGGFCNAGDVVLLVAPGGSVTAIDGATGKERWHRTLPGHAQPVLTACGDDSVYAAEQAGDGASTLISAVNPASGKVDWQRRLDGTLTPVGVSGGALYLTEANDASQTDAVVRYDPVHRKAVRVPLAQPLENTESTLQGTRVYLLSHRGALVAVDTAHRAQLWRTETSVAEASKPVVSGGRLYFTAADGRLLAVDAASGVPTGQTRARIGKDPSRYVQSVPAPLAVGGRVYATAPDGTVFAVDAKDPSRW
ncbi:protein kinase domain-containing protein [Actinacidiphila soli]|uniref:serine/threonine-protein kinase n=1 Tax=Actinacidiphila soli TaxID=2487275 RepID=UPI000FCB8896|nr:serine/threonine-protein kinase [Actinacidiphila soli]